LLTEKGIVSAEELSGAVVPLPVGRSHNPKLTADKVAALMDKGGNFRRENGKPARFRVGQPVRARNIHPAGHTRLPWYARGKTGEIVADYGLHVFADTNAHGHEDAQHLYNVRFSSTELWGPDGTVGDFVHIDLWDAHLETVR
jgi:nitrile hydratase